MKILMMLTSRDTLKMADWQPFSVVDGRLITGQNPASSTVAAQNLLNFLAVAKKAA